jgi:hypothetical protein
MVFSVESMVVELDVLGREVVLLFQFLDFASRQSAVDRVDPFERVDVGCLLRLEFLVQLFLVIIEELHESIEVLGDCY